MNSYGLGYTTGKFDKNVFRKSQYVKNKETMSFYESILSSATKLIPVNPPESIYDETNDLVDLVATKNITKEFEDIIENGEIIYSVDIETLPILNDYITEVGYFAKEVKSLPQGDIEFLSEKFNYAMGIIPNSDEHANLQSLITKIKSLHGDLTSLTREERATAERLILYSGQFEDRYKQYTVNGKTFFGVKELNVVAKQNSPAEAILMEQGLENFLKLGDNKGINQNKYSNITKEIMKLFKNEIGDQYIIGHNVRNYDLSRLQEYFESIGIDLPIDREKTLDMLDLIRSAFTGEEDLYVKTLNNIAQTYNKDFKFGKYGPFTMDTIADAFGFNYSHNATKDAEQLTEVFFSSNLFKKTSELLRKKYNQKLYTPAIGDYFRTEKSIIKGMLDFSVDKDNNIIDWKDYLLSRGTTNQLTGMYSFSLNELQEKGFDAKQIKEYYKMGINDNSLIAIKLLNKKGTETYLFRTMNQMGVKSSEEENGIESVTKLFQNFFRKIEEYEPEMFDDLREKDIARRLFEGFTSTKTNPIVKGFEDAQNYYDAIGKAIELKNANIDFKDKTLSEYLSYLKTTNSTKEIKKITKISNKNGYLDFNNIFQLRNIFTETYETNSKIIKEIDDAVETYLTEIELPAAKSKSLSKKNYIKTRIFKEQIEQIQEQIRQYYKENGVETKLASYKGEKVVDEVMRLASKGRTKIHLPINPDERKTLHFESPFEDGKIFSINLSDREKTKKSLWGIWTQRKKDKSEDFFNLNLLVEKLKEEKILNKGFQIKDEFSDDWNISRLATKLYSRRNKPFIKEKLGRTLGFNFDQYIVTDPYFLTYTNPILPDIENTKYTQIAQQVTEKTNIKMKAIQLITEELSNFDKVQIDTNDSKLKKFSPDLKHIFYKDEFHNLEPLQDILKNELGYRDIELFDFSRAFFNTWYSEEQGDTSTGWFTMKKGKMGGVFFKDVDSEKWYVALANAEKYADELDIIKTSKSVNDKTKHMALIELPRIETLGDSTIAFYKGMVKENIIEYSSYYSYVKDPKNGMFVPTRQSTVGHMYSTFVMQKGNAYDLIIEGKGEQGEKLISNEMTRIMQKRATVDSQKILYNGEVKEVLFGHTQNTFQKVEHMSLLKNMLKHYYKEGNKYNFSFEDKNLQTMYDNIGYTLEAAGIDEKEFLNKLFYEKGSSHGQVALHTNSLTSSFEILEDTGLLKQLLELNRYTATEDYVIETIDKMLNEIEDLTYHNKESHIKQGTAIKGDIYTSMPFAETGDQNRPPMSQQIAGDSLLRSNIESMQQEINEKSTEKNPLQMFFINDTLRTEKQLQVSDVFTERAMDKGIQKTYQIIEDGNVIEKQEQVIDVLAGVTRVIGDDEIFEILDKFEKEYLFKLGDDGEKIYDPEKMLKWAKHIKMVSDDTTELSDFNINLIKSDYAKNQIISRTSEQGVGLSNKAIDQRMYGIPQSISIEMPNELKNRITEGEVTEEEIFEKLKGVDANRKQRLYFDDIEIPNNKVTGEVTGVRNGKILITPYINKQISTQITETMDKENINQQMIGRIFSESELIEYGVDESILQQFSKGEKAEGIELSWIENGQATFKTVRNTEQLAQVKMIMNASEKGMGFTNLGESSEKMFQHLYSLEYVVNGEKAKQPVFMIHNFDTEKHYSKQTVVLDKILKIANWNNGQYRDTLLENLPEFYNNEFGDRITSKQGVEGLIYNAYNLGEKTYIAGDILEQTQKLVDKYINDPEVDEGLKTALLDDKMVVALFNAGKQNEVMNIIGDDVEEIASKGLGFGQREAQMFGTHWVATKGMDFKKVSKARKEYIQHIFGEDIADMTIGKEKQVRSFINIIDAMHYNINPSYESIGEIFNPHEMDIETVFKLFPENNFEDNVYDMSLFGNKKSKNGRKDHIKVLLNRSIKIPYLNNGEETTSFVLPNIPFSSSSDKYFFQEPHRKMKEFVNLMYEWNKGNLGSEYTTVINNKYLEMEKAFTTVIHKKAGIYETLESKRLPNSGMFSIDIIPMRGRLVTTHTQEMGLIDGVTKKADIAKELRLIQQGESKAIEFTDLDPMLEKFVKVDKKKGSITFYDGGFIGKEGLEAAGIELTDDIRKNGIDANLLRFPVFKKDSVRLGRVYVDENILGHTVHMMPHTTFIQQGDKDGDIEFLFFSRAKSQEENRRLIKEAQASSSIEDFLRVLENDIAEREETTEGKTVIRSTERKASNQVSNAINWKREKEWQESINKYLDEGRSYKDAFALATKQKLFIATQTKATKDSAIGRASLPNLTLRDVAIQLYDNGTYEGTKQLQNIAKFTDFTEQEIISIKHKTMSERHWADDYTNAMQNLFNKKQKRREEAVNLLESILQNYGEKHKEEIPDWINTLKDIFLTKNFKVADDIWINSQRSSRYFDVLSGDAWQLAEQTWLTELKENKGTTIQNRLLRDIMYEDIKIPYYNVKNATGNYSRLYKNDIVTDLKRTMKFVGSKRDQEGVSYLAFEILNTKPSKTPESPDISIPEAPKEYFKVYGSSKQARYEAITNANLFKITKASEKDKINLLNQHLSRFTKESERVNFINEILDYTETNSSGFGKDILKNKDYLDKTRASKKFLNELQILKQNDIVSSDDQVEEMLTYFNNTIKKKAGSDELKRKILTSNVNISKLSGKQQKRLNTSFRKFMKSFKEEVPTVPSMITINDIKILDNKIERLSKITKETTEEVYNQSKNVINKTYDLSNKIKKQTSNSLDSMSNKMSSKSMLLAAGAITAIAFMLGSNAGKRPLISDTQEEAGLIETQTAQQDNVNKNKNNPSFYKTIYLQEPNNVSVNVNAFSKKEADKRKLDDIVVNSGINGNANINFIDKRTTINDRWIQNKIENIM